jgi:hypothetical protein
VKYVCESCERLLEVKSFRVDAGSLVLTCPACGQESRTGVTPGAGPPPLQPSVSATPRAQLASTQAGSNVVELRLSNRESTERARTVAAESPFAVPEGHCPKCISPRAPEAKSCRSCGADFSLLSADMMMPSAWLQTAWIALLGRWGELDQHDALVVEALGKGEMPALGRLYRLYLSRVPADPLALRGREEVVRRASVPGLAAPSRQQTENPPWLVGLVVVMGMAVLIGFIVLVRALLEPPS